VISIDVDHRQQKRHLLKNINIVFRATFDQTKKNIVLNFLNKTSCSKFTKKELDWHRLCYSQSTMSLNDRVRHRRLNLSLSQLFTFLTFLADQVRRMAA